jgi:uncharacterized membrane protein YkvA (DUF1232 family)
MTEKLAELFSRLVRDIRPEHEAEVRSRFTWAETRARARGAAEDLLESVRTLWKMLTDPDFVVSWETKSWIVAALVYFISPADVIPDVIPGLGYIDDATVVAWCLHQVAEEVVRYRAMRGQA